MNEADRRAACGALEEIETDLVFGLIESYRDSRMEEFAEDVETVRSYIEIREKVCSGRERRRRA